MPEKKLSPLHLCAFQTKLLITTNKMNYKYMYIYQKLSAHFISQAFLFFYEPRFDSTLSCTIIFYLFYIDQKAYQQARLFSHNENYLPSNKTTLTCRFFSGCSKSPHRKEKPTEEKEKNENKNGLLPLPTLLRPRRKPTSSRSS